MEFAKSPGSKEWQKNYNLVNAVLSALTPEEIQQLSDFLLLQNNNQENKQIPEEQPDFSDFNPELINKLQPLLNTNRPESKKRAPKSRTSQRIRHARDVEKNGTTIKARQTYYQLMIIWLKEHSTSFSTIRTASANLTESTDAP